MHLPAGPTRYPVRRTSPVPRFAIRAATRAILDPPEPAVRTLAAAAIVCSLVAACEEQGPAGPAPSRFAAVKREANNKAALAFCEKQWPVGEGSKPFTAPPERPIPGAPAAVAPEPRAWTWVNLWATWCKPCVEEMGLLARWKDSLKRDGVALNVEFWSVDESEADLTTWLKQHRLPGQVHWLRSVEDLPPALERIGADKASAIPIHALVDGHGNLRCLRVGSVHDEDYGAVKSILSGA